MTDDEVAADVIVLNSCAIREKAEHKLVSAVGRFRPLKRDNPDLLLAIGGCMPTLEGQSLLDHLPLVDFTFGPDAIARLPDLIETAQRAKKRFSATAFTNIEEYEFLDADPSPSETPVTALVTIQKGCDNDCAYCVVPLTRGPEVSRPMGSVLAEVERFVECGAREITLIGQNVNSYHGAEGDFVELLTQVAKVPGLLRLRFTTSHPKDFDASVADCFRYLPQLCEWLHLPVQSGSTKVLRSMMRTYTRDEYLRKIDYLRSVCPDIALTTDVIVGYPGETDADFQDTLSLLDGVKYDSIYSFKYSPRPKTSAERLGDPVPDAVKNERLTRVQELQRGITQERLGRFVGRTEEILVEGESRSGGLCCGRTRTNHVVNFTLPEGVLPTQLRGQLVSVHVSAARTHTLAGMLATVFLGRPHFLAGHHRGCRASRMARRLRRHPASRAPVLVSGQARPPDRLRCSRMAFGYCAEKPLSAKSDGCVWPSHHARWTH